MRESGGGEQKLLKGTTGNIWLITFQNMVGIVHLVTNITSIQVCQDKVTQK